MMEAIAAFFATLKKIFTTADQAVDVVGKVVHTVDGVVDVVDLNVQVLRNEAAARAKATELI